MPYEGGFFLLEGVKLLSVPSCLDGILGLLSVRINRRGA